MLEQLAAPVVHPVSLAQAKAWVRETTTDSDAVLDFLRKAAVARAETLTHRAIVYRPVREQFDWLPPYFELSGFPVRGIKLFTYIDQAGVTQTISSSGYLLDKTKGAARITPPYAQFFSPPRLVMNNCQVTYDIGMLVPITAVDTTADTLTIPGLNAAAGDIVQISTDGDPSHGTSSGIAPTGLTLGTAYYVVNPTNGGDTVQLALTPAGAAIDLTAAGSTPLFVGILPDEMLLAMQLMIDTWFRNRSSVSPTQVWEMPSVGAAESLLAPYAIRGFA